MLAPRGGGAGPGRRRLNVRGGSTPRRDKIPSQVIQREHFSIEFGCTSIGLRGCGDRLFFYHPLFLITCISIWYHLRCFFYQIEIQVLTERRHCHSMCVKIPAHA